MFIFMEVREKLSFYVIHHHSILSPLQIVLFGGKKTYSITITDRRRKKNRERITRPSQFPIIANAINHGGWREE